MANPEHLVMLKRGVEVWNRWRRVHVHPEVDLSGADLSEADLAVTFAGLGKREHADALYTEMLARVRRQYVPPAQLALAAAAASRESEAIHHTREAFEIRDPNCQVFFSRHVPYSAPLYTYPRFCEMVARMGRSDWLRD
jgi:hypothetical protein